MKYYRLKYKIKEVGTYPQCQESIDVGDMRNGKIPIEGRIDIKFKLPVLKLENRSKLTSALSTFLRMRFLIIDDLFLEFIKQFNIDDFQSWKIDVWQNKKLLTKYNMFTTNNSKQNCIDFNKSIFRTGTYSDFTYKGDIIKIKDYTRYLIKVEELKKKELRIRHEKIVYNFENVKEDLFRTPFESYYFVSEKLKNAIEKENFTGIKFEDIAKP